MVSGANVILSTPTGSGKSLVAAAAHFTALAQDKVTFYTAPIKALVSEKFFDLCKLFGTENVGMLTGDASVNADAPVICCTAEVLASIALRDGKYADIGQVVMDEFHFYAKPDRGWAWQIPLLELRQAQFVLMSATLGDVSMFEKDLTRRTGRPTSVVRSATRPVPLSYEYRFTPITETLTELLDTRQSPVYIVHFTQAAAVERAQSLMSINMCTKEEKERIADMIGGFRFTTKSGQNLSGTCATASGCAPRGDAARVPPAGEKLAQAGLLKVTCGTDTPWRRRQRYPIRTCAVRRRSPKYEPGPGCGPCARGNPTRSRGAPGGPGSGARPASSWRRPRSTSSKTRRPSRRRATTRRRSARWSVRRPPRGSSPGRRPTFDKLITSEPRAAERPRLRVAHTTLPSRSSPVRATRVSRRCGICWRTTTSRAGAACGTSGGPSPSTLLAAGRQVVEQLSDARTPRGGSCG
ncbi:Helicase OS=Streptomyces microflavus OX=1919 GN=Smic_05630 PE=4 SV=1 [Streptomyces microflavus]